MAKLFYFATLERIYMNRQYLTSPIGLIEIQAHEKGITEVKFVEKAVEAEQQNAITELCHEQLEAYFQQHLTSFTVPLAAQGTYFQNQVWQALTEIPYGKSWSYLELAQHINNPKAVRAVGGANGKNPIAIIVPCHRVIGANGTLTGYASGVERKAWLLEHEGIKL